MRRAADYSPGAMSGLRKVDYKQRQLVIVNADAGEARFPL